MDGDLLDPHGFDPVEQGHDNLSGEMPTVKGHSQRDSAVAERGLTCQFFQCLDPPRCDETGLERQGGRPRLDPRVEAVSVHGP